MSTNQPWARQAVTTASPRALGDQFAARAASSLPPLSVTFVGSTGPFQNPSPLSISAQPPPETLLHQ